LATGLASAFDKINILTSEDYSRLKVIVFALQGAYLPRGSSIIKKMKPDTMISSTFLN